MPNTTLLQIPNRKREKILGSNIAKLENDLIGYLKNITGDLNLALDLAQETILKSIDFKGPSASPPSEISITKPYILKIARNLAIDHYRKFGKRIDLIGNEMEKLDSDHDSNVPSPEFLLIEKEEKVVVTRSFGKLKPAEREILSLYYYNDLNLKEISSLLEIPLNTAITKLCRARRELKKIILKDGSYEMP